MKITHVLTLCLVIITSGCTYAPPKSMTSFDYAIRADESEVAILVERYLSHRPTGWAAFPDGGLHKTTDQFIDVYVVDLRTKSILYKHTIDPHSDGRIVSLDPWIVGWAGNDVYIKITGCHPRWDHECHGDLRKAYFYAINHLSAYKTNAPPPPAKKIKSFVGPKGVASPAGTGSYISFSDSGVWIVGGYAEKSKTLLLGIEGTRLIPVSSRP